MKKTKIFFSALGAAGVGKTSFIRALLSSPEAYQKEYSPTFVEVYENDVLKGIEFGGSSTVESRKRSCYYRVRELHCHLLCFSLDNYESDLRNLTQTYLKELKKYCLVKKSLILVGLKKDKLDEIESERVDEMMKEIQMSYRMLDYFLVSVKNSVGVDSVKRSIVNSYKQQIMLASSPLPKEKKKSSLLSIISNSEAGGLNIASIAGRTVDPATAAEQKRREELVMRMVSGNELIFYSFHGNVKEVRRLVEVKYENINMKDNRKCSPLYYAVANRRADVIRLLLSYPDITANDLHADGQTVLTLASKSEKYSDILDILLKSNKIDTERKNKYCLTPIELANNNEQIMKKFIEKEKNELKFFKYIRAKNLKKVIEYLQKVNIRCKTENEETALEVALKIKDNEQIIKLLIDNGILIRKEFYKHGPQYKNLIYESYNRRKRYQIVVELLQTEKTYCERLRFVKKYYVSVAKKQSNKLIKKEKDRKRLMDYFNLLIKIYNNCMLILSETVKIVNSSGMGDEMVKKIVKLFEKLELDSYLHFISTKATLDSDIKELPEYSEIYKAFKEKGKEIVFKRAKIGLFNLLNLPKERIVQYQNLLAMLLKYSKIENQKEPIYGCIREVLADIKLSMQEFDDKVRNEQNMRQVHNIFSSKYKVKTIQKNPSRKHVFHKLDLLSINYKDKSLKKLSMFIFSDLIVLGIKGETVSFYFFRDTKVVFTLNRDNVRITIYRSQPKIERLADFVAFSTHGVLKLLQETLTEFFTSKFGDFYFSTIYILNHLDDEDEKNEFLVFNEENQIEIKCERRLKLKKKMDHVVAKYDELEDIDKEIEESIRELVSQKRELRLKREAEEMLKLYGDKNDDDLGEDIKSPLVMKI